MTRRRRFAVALAALLVAGCPSLKAPDERARAALADLSARGFTVEVPGGAPLRIPPGKLAFTGLHADEAERGTLRVFGQLSLEGWVGERPVSYVGAETLRVVCDRSCRVEGPAVPRLAGVLAEVVPGADERGAGGWFIRVEREEALVGEAARDGTRQRQTLVREGDRWVAKHAAR